MVKRSIETVFATLWVYDLTPNLKSYYMKNSEVDQLKTRNHVFQRAMEIHVFHVDARIKHNFPLQGVPN